MGEVYAAVTDRILINLARHFKYIAAGKTPGSGWDYQVRKLAEMGKVTKETEAIILQSMAGGDEALRETLEETIRQSLKPIEKPLTIVLASDLHIGYHNRKTELARWVDLINSEHPDVVLIGGDVIDRSLRPVIEDNYAEVFRRIKVPVYTVLGNHEYFGNV